jgi:hypothetical protein
LLAHALRRAGLATDVAGDVIEAKRLLGRSHTRFSCSTFSSLMALDSTYSPSSRRRTSVPLQIVVVTAAEPSMLDRLDRSLVKTVTFKPLDRRGLRGVDSDSHAGPAIAPVKEGSRNAAAHGSLVVMPPFFFMFRPQPAHHARSPFLRWRVETWTPSARSTRCRERPPRGVIVFAERSDQTGAAQPQKRRRHFTPSHRPWVRASRPHVSPAHAPSRRLQRVSVSCTRVSRGQAPRRRPPRPASLPIPEWI